jgi:type I restriction enzyme M protein
MNKDAFLSLLPALGFTKQGPLWTKTFGAARLTVDTKNEKFVYPDGLTVHEQQTCNFKQPENFVVFECVHRLLEKGYAAAHLELEPKWKLGHDTKSGRADILIKDNDGRSLLIIECKTAGKEFSGAWKQTQHDGGQLFSYLTQVSETQFLCLYCSEPNDDGTGFRYASHVIAHRDNEKYLAENPTFKSFRDATNTPARFAVWRDTYKLDSRTGGIFEPTIQPYHIGKDKYSLADLHPISASEQQKKYHEFATILRQHNVSGRENAFDKLINLFLCKLVDESQHPDDLKFYWKGIAFDTHFQLLDRLQQLYQAGMEKFLGEKITYIAESDVSAALRFVRHNPDATQRAVWNLFIQQKFFTNNDFSFIDVHNENLFYQNADVLLKILQMWQDIRLASPDAHNQFLGDMFEFFLDQGVKQTEGQFFTPGPICRFLLMCLPLEAMVKKDAVPPKAIDYACGAGHFLTELAKQLKTLVEKHHPKLEGRMDDYHAAILGVEKEYRLSKIAKVSAFMYGQPRIKICYGDALVSEHEAYPEIVDGTFNLLVANPPFSVKGFLETLPARERERYTLTATIKDLDSSNSIETFFLERARQLLQPGGIAAIILPSSILSNGGGTYVATRALLLRSFDIVAIAEFGSGTFGRTGTNTVALFLRRKAIGPETAAHFEERVAEWFKGTDNDKRRQVAYKDVPLLDHYAAHIGIPSPDYKTLLCGAPNAALLAHETFAAYRRTFDSSTETKGLATKGWFKRLTDAEKQAELAKRFLAYVQTVERDKLLHFVLADQQPGPVLIMRCPTDTKEQKRFLGYEWSGAKGDEGIKLFKDAAGRHLTPLYDEADRDNPAKINHAIAQNFLGKLSAVPAELENHLSLVPLAELLDFSRPDFEKQIALAAKKIVTVASKWPLEAMGTVVEVLIGGTPARENRAFYEGRNPWVSIAEMRGQVITDTKEKITDAAVAKSNVKLIPRGTTLLSFKLSIGKTAIAGCDLYTNEAIAGLIPRDRSKLIDEFLFHLFHAKHIDLTGSGYKAFGKSLNSAFLRDDVKIPIPPLDIQRAIVAECEAVDAEAAKVQAEIEQAQQEIVGKVQAQLKGKHPERIVDSLLLPVNGHTTKIPENEIHEAGAVAVVTQEQEKLISGYTDHAEAINDLPLVVFGDHTCIFKYVDFSFVRGADGTQLLKFDATLMNPRFFAQIAPHLEITNSGKYERHFKYVKVLRVPVPSLKEQERFVKEVEVLETKIATARATLRATASSKEAILKKHL